MRLLFILSCLPLLSLSAQTDSLLRAYHWTEEGSERRLLLTPDGTFQLDFGPAAGETRYLMGRYELDSLGRELTLAVDYFLGKSRIHARYRRKRDFYFVYDIITLNDRRLVLLDQLTDDLLAFLPAPLEAADDPARRRVSPPNPAKIVLPPGWGG